MRLKLFNTISNRKETFKPLKKGRVMYYTCGPTVHDYAHIGNFRTFVVQDVLKRWLKTKDYSVKHVMNITDVDEKTIERAARRKIPLKKLTEKYEKAFYEDLECLNIEKADHYPRVSDNIQVIAGMVEGLIKYGYAIKGDNGSYFFDINKFKDYGTLSGRRPLRKIRARISREDYKSPKNFLLWKNCEKATNAACWDHPIGRGRPGWHIECAALAHKYLVETIDIHSGGVDLIFPHHENEIAEAESFTGKPFSRFWVHVEHLVVYGKKMSKSQGNFYTLRQIMKKNLDPRAMRLLYLKTHYRSKLNFSFESLKAAEGDVELIEDVSRRLGLVDKNGKAGHQARVKEFKRVFSDSMDDDLQTDKALAHYIDFLKHIDRALEDRDISKNDAAIISKTMAWVNSVLGLMGECLLTP